MNSLWLIVFAIAAMLLGYRFYGNFVAKRLGVDPKRPTPAHTMNDGVDYVPAKAPVLLGHHFASIAGASPIIGPVLAAVYGWVPVVLWILVGGIFMGAVHDFSALIASVRHQGRSIGEVIEERVGRDGKRLFLAFSFFALILVMSAFMIIVSKTFADNPSAGSSSILFIFLALVFGVIIKRTGVSLSVASIIGVGLLFLCVYLGLKFPVTLSTNTWLWLLVIYIFAAATSPVWLLLQPRDYLNSFLLYALMIGAVVGIIVARPDINFAGYAGFDQEIGYLFPLLFVTVACGAISGFHSLVASGTTSKQLNSEKDAKLIGYGGMLIECLLAVVAIITVAVLTKADYDTLISGGPVALFANGVGEFMSHLGIPQNTGKTFAALAVSAFALTSLDTATRLCRFSFQEFFSPKTGKKSNVFLTNRYVGTAISIFIGAGLAFSGKWELLWPLFGSANQMLAALALLGVTVWLASRGIRFGFTLIPMIFMFLATISALVILILKTFDQSQFVLMFFGIALLAVAMLVLILAVKRVSFK
ncbi:carbon starvation protein A, partial [candidate division KSB1 bacterium]